jgi:hypothetical protein
VGNGQLTQFWDDVWVTSSPMRLHFPNMYAICEPKMLSVADCAADGWQIKFRRMLGDTEMGEWSELQSLISGISMAGQEDEITWGLSSSKNFTTRSLYRFLTKGGMDSKLIQRI